MSLIYGQSTIGTPSNSITFNNYSTTPIYRVRQTIPTRRDIREQDANIPESMGVSDFQALEGKSYFIIEGEVKVRNEDEYYRGREKLRKLGSLEIEQADASSDFGYVPYTWTESGRGRQMFVKVMYVDGLGESTRQAYTQKFRIFCKIKYPVIFGTTVKSALLNVASSIATTGGATIPSTIPTLIGSTGSSSGTMFPAMFPITFGASSATAGGTVTNEGNIGAYPTIQIYGPCSRPKVLNNTTGEYLEFDITLGVGQAIVLTYDQDTVSMIGPDGNSIYNKMTAGSTLLRVKPGINNFSLTGSFLDSTAYASVNFLDAYPMS